MRSRMVALSEVVILNPRMPKSLVEDLEQPVAFVPMASVSERGVLSKFAERPLKEVVKGFTYFESGDVLVAKITPCMENGKACLVPELPYKAGFGSTEFHVLRATEAIDRRYLFHCIWNANFRKEAAKNMTGSAGQKRVPAHFLNSYKISLPPLTEQNRIAVILDKADAIRQKREKAIELIDSFLRSVFLEVFGEPVTNPNHWIEAPLADMCDVSSGITKGRKLDGKITRAIPYLRVANVQDSYLNLSEIKTIPATSEDLIRYNLLKGDMLMTEGGDPDKLGRGALWNDEIPNCVYQNHIFRVRIREGKASILHPEFLSALVGSRRGKLYFLREAKQTTGIATINSRQLKSFPLFLPPIELQTKYVEIAHRVNQLKIRFNEFESDSRQLKTSLSQILFDHSVSRGSPYTCKLQQQEAHAL